MEELGTGVVERALEIAVEMAINDSVDSLPPAICLVGSYLLETMGPLEPTFKNRCIARLDC